MLVGQNWMYDVMIYIYTLSILFYFSDFLNNNRRVNRTAFGLLTMVWVLQTIYFAGEVMEKTYFPVLTLFQSLFFYSWILVTLSLVIHYFFKVDFFVFFTNIIGFTVLALNLFTNQQAPITVSDELISELLIIHISLAFLSYGAFSLSFIFSVMYLIQHKLLKEKQWNHKLRRLPSLKKLDAYTFRLNMTGVPLLLLSIILGLIWGYLSYQTVFVTDAKVLMSILVLLVFSGYLYQRVVAKRQGRGLSLWNVGAFIVMFINFLVSGSVSSFHQW